MKYLLILTSLLLPLNLLSAYAHDRQINKEVTVNASIESAWKAWTTVKGTQRFFAPKAEIRLEPGGDYNMLWTPNAPKGQRGAEDLVVLDYSERKMLSFTWSAPPQFPTIRQQERTRVTIIFNAVNDTATKIILIHDQWGEGELNGEKWEGVYDYFVKAWDTVLGRFIMSIEQKPVDWNNSFGFREVVDMKRVVDKSKW